MENGKGGQVEPKLTSVKPDKVHEQLDKRMKVDEGGQCSSSSSVKKHYELIISR